VAAPAARKRRRVGVFGVLAEIRRSRCVIALSRRFAAVAFEASDVCVVR
jgi:hypothetical protein